MNNNIIVNINEAAALAEKYLSITMDDIEKAIETCKLIVKDVTPTDYFRWIDVKINLTGFGNSQTCTLCQAADCPDCIYQKVGNVSCTAHRSYMLIKNCHDKELLLKYYHIRGNYINSLIERAKKLCLV